MIACPNKNSVKYKTLLKEVGESRIYIEWNKRYNEDWGKVVSNESNKLESLKDDSINDIVFNFDKKEEVVQDNTKDTIRDNSTINFILFNDESGKFTAKDVLKNISNNFKGTSNSAEDILNKLIPILGTTNANVRFVSDRTFKSDKSIMEYDPFRNEIIISRDRLKDMSEEYVVRSFLHEVVHSVTVNALSNPKTVEGEMFKSFIEDMYREYKAWSGTKEGDTVTEENYGFHNTMEFVAELLTNPMFQEEFKRLENIKTDRIKSYRSLWDRLIDNIRLLLGLKKMSDYNTILDNLTQVIEKDDYRGGISLPQEFYAKERAEKEETSYYKLDTIEEKQDFLINEIKNNLERNISLYDHIVKQVKDPEKIKKYSDKLKEILDNVEDLDKTQKWKAITVYVSHLNNTVNSLQSRFEKEDFTDEEILKTIGLYHRYLQSNAMVDSIQAFLSDAITEQDLPVTKEEINVLRDSVEQSTGKYTRLESDFLAYHRKALFPIFNQRKYATRVLKSWRVKLGKEYDQLNIKEPKEAWISRQMNTTYSEEIDAEVEQDVRNIFESPDFDITNATRLANAAINTNSRMIQLMQIKFNEVRENIIDRNRTIDLELKDLFDEFIKSKGNKKASVLYKNMLEYSKDGMVLLKGEYSIKFKEKYEELLAKHNEYKDKVGKIYEEGSAEYKQALSDTDFRKWVKENTNLVRKESKDGNIRYRREPIDKWKNNLSNLSAIEIKVLERFRKVMEDSNKETFGINSLISDPLMGARYYKLPSVTRKDMERVLEGDAKGMVTDKFKDLDIRVDDIGYEEKNVTIANNVIHKLKVNLRGNIDANDQSLDLFTVMRLEARNGINFQEKNKVEMEINTLMDVAKHKRFYESTGARVPVMGKFLKRNKRLTVRGEVTNTYKRMESLVESNVYDILHKNVGKLGKIDGNKAIGFVNAWTGMIGMALNEVSATTNVLNGKAQMFLEVVAGNYVTAKSLKKAESIYFNELKNNLKDINNPIKVSRVNQITEMFDTFGSVAVTTKQAFIQNTMLKANANLKSLSFMQESGEHWLSSVLTMAVLENIKVLNGNNKFINKEGKEVTSEKEAASVLEMLKPDSTGKIVMDKSVVYTTHTIGVKYSQGGKEMLNALVKKKVFDTLGNYDPNMQPEAMRHGYGKLLLMYRKFLVPMGLARFRGFSYVDKKLDDLENHELFFSEALQDYETGTYTELLRYTITGIIPALKNLKLQLIKENWRDLNDTQKKQIHKAISEIGLAFVMIPLLVMLLKGLTDDEEDDSWLFFMLLNTRRLQSELQSFSNVQEQWRILQSPIPSMRVVESLMHTATTLLSPWDWGDTYKSGKNEGNFKMFKYWQELTPVLNSTNTSYKEKYTFIENMAN